MGIIVAIAMLNHFIYIYFGNQIITNETENESVYRGNNWPGESKIRIQRVQAASPPLSGSFDIQASGRILKGI